MGVITPPIDGTHDSVELEVAEWVGGTKLGPYVGSNPTLNEFHILVFYFSATTPTQ